MLTPRRTLLLLAGFVLFGVAYGIYSRALGWIDGLPQLPDKFLTPSAGSILPPKNIESPTQAKLARAFGKRSPETDYALYETQLEFPSGNSSIVVAAGPAPANPRSKRVPLTPFSLAIFSKPKPEHLRQPGEVAEITTIHSDKAILEFDREINNPNDMRSAKLVRLELVSDFNQTFEDPRRGLIHITNNQRSDDPNNLLVVRTSGPVFYRDAKAVAGTPAAQGPDFWTDAPVEIVDRQNLPRAIGSLSPATVESKSEELRNPAIVADILAGRRSPPPTVTAIGFRLYLEPDTPSGQPQPKKSGAMQGVRRFEFLEQVTVNLWVDGGQSLIGSGTPPQSANTSDPPPRSNSLAHAPPPAAIAAVTGGLGPAAYTAKLMNRALLQIETRGPFAYDADRATARFEVVPHSDPNLPNDVRVTKVSIREGLSSLFSQVLELDFNGGPTAGARPTNSPAIKKLHAWTYTPGRLVTVTSQNENLQAYGQDLVHDQVNSRTILTGPEVHVVRERNVLKAGTPQQPATLIMEPGPTPRSKSQATVRGPGRVDLIDAANGNIITATWQTSLVQLKETINGREQDLFVFTDDAKFEDKKSDFWLKGNLLKLWLEPQAPPKPDQTKTATRGNGQAKPSHIQAIGQVTSHSAEYDIKKSDQLNVFFEDTQVKPTVVVVAPTSPAKPPVDPPATTPPAQTSVTSALKVETAAPKQPEPRPKEAEKPKPPMQISAKDIKMWVNRVAVPPAKAEGKPSDKLTEQPASTTKYQLDRAVCEDDVVVHQDPIDPAKPRGVDILGRWLEVIGSPDGNVLTVHGWPTRPGEVHQEEMSLVGPVVVIDQLHNAASVKGRGALTMPTNSDLAGTELKQSEVVVIHWRDEMEFRGALRSAKFLGKVTAQQGESWVLCHTMHVTFDRPVYFNQMQKKPQNPKAGGGARGEPADPKDTKNDRAKIDTVDCYPAAGDSADNDRELYVTYCQVEYDVNRKMVKWQQLRALELKMEAQVRDPDGGAPYQRVRALGPGKYHVWQPGDKELAGPGPAGANQNAPMQPKQPDAKPMKQEQEMKLTIVDFNDQMIAIDKGKVLQQATFTKNVKAISVPANSPMMDVEEKLLPPRSLLLTCNKELVVWNHKKANAPAVQRMDASGNAYVRSDEYDGWADTIQQDGKLVRLTGSNVIPARIKHRFKREGDSSGEVITYDRAKGTFNVVGSFGGTFGQK